MNYMPIARIILRYAVGAVIGSDLGDILAMDPDVVTFVALGIGTVVEILYGMARKKGLAT